MVEEGAPWQADGDKGVKLCARVNQPQDVRPLSQTGWFVDMKRLDRGRCDDDDVEQLTTEYRVM